MYRDSIDNFKFVCTNEKCDRFGLSKSEFAATCPSCKKDMTSIDEA